MPIASLQRIHADETIAALTLASDLVNRSGVVELIENAAAETASHDQSAVDPTAQAIVDDDSAQVEPNAHDETVVPISHATRRRGGGAPVRLPQYNVAMFLKVIFELAWRCDSFTWTRFAYAVWFRYTEDEMAAIGLRGWRDPARAAAMRPAAFQAAGEDGAPYVRVLGTEDLHRLEASQRLWRAEVTRLQDQMKRLLAPIDDTPLPAGRRHTMAETAAARTQTHDAARDLCHLVRNRLVRAGLEVANSNYYPDVSPEDLFGGLLADFKGDVGIDEHNVVISTSYGQRTKVRSSVSMARFAGHVRREKQAMAIGLSAAIAVSRPESPKVASVLVGFDLHDAASEANLGGRNALAAMEAVGLRPAINGRGHQYVVVDKAYPHYKGFAQHLLANNWSILGKYVTGTDTIQGGAPFVDMAPTDAPAPGPYQFNGVFLCPGIGATYLAENRGFDIPRDQDVTPTWLVSNDAKVEQLTAAVMTTNGRPKPRKHARRGRPSAHAEPIENQWTVEVRCPAAANNPKVRCPRVETSMTLPADDFPTLHHAPKFDQPAPKCCTDDHGAMQLVMNEKHIKNWQPKMAGSWEHQDFYAPARNTTEQYFSRLKDRSTADLNLGKIEWQRNAFVAMAITASVLVTNNRIIDKWEENLRANGSVPPPGAGPRRRAFREYLRSK